MADFPFNIPKSLSSYVERFDEDPAKITGKLKRHLKKRGPDAVGHFLLSWFYYLQDKQSDAIREALKAKTFAPGSPLMEHLHYFLVHPEKFEAAVPDRSFSSDRKILQQGKRTSQILDLDRLIELLEAVESQRIRIPENDDGEQVDLSESSTDVDDLVSETLARIHVKQGKKKEAIRMYEQLIKLKPEKAEEFEDQIQVLKESS
ncbi:tetratricopeptide repeat protein [Balneola sp. MJW-20]|uniref:tetratricopeptide repeat protein n=1 Tax=Gracilimonas aurantiaca TaxID=3234185 RepID=UPI003465CAA9